MDYNKVSKVYLEDTDKGIGMLYAIGVFFEDKKIINIALDYNGIFVEFHYENGDMERHYNIKSIYFSKEDQQQ